MDLKPYISSFSLRTWVFLSQLSGEQGEAEKTIREKVKSNPDLEFIANDPQLLEAFASPTHVFRQCLTPLISGKLQEYTWGRIQNKSCSTQAVYGLYIFDGLWKR